MKFSHKISSLAEFLIPLEAGFILPGIGVKPKKFGLARISHEEHQMLFFILHYYSLQFWTWDKLMYNLLISYYFSILFDVLHEKFGLESFKTIYSILEAEKNQH